MIWYDMHGFKIEQTRYSEIGDVNLECDARYHMSTILPSSDLKQASAPAHSTSTRSPSSILNQRRLQYPGYLVDLLKLLLRAWPVRETAA